VFLGMANFFQEQSFAMLFPFQGAEVLDSHLSVPSPQTRASFPWPRPFPPIPGVPRWGAFSVLRTGGRVVLLP